MAINILDADTVSRIAAGEVIERPASVIKELVENSIDSGATSITVDIREGGTEYIRVTDNGCGIAPEDARFAFMNHATSKLHSGDMLTDIRTLGFRGEALPSISSVAKVEMKTRVKGGETGVLVRINGGVFQEMKETGCAEGTSITVSELFFNVPARKAFLKRPATEAGVVSDIITKLILGNPKVSIRLTSNGRVVYHSYGDGTMKSAVLAALGRDTAAAMKEIDIFEGALRITGFVGLGELAKQNRAMQYFFINGRTIKCALLSAALESASKERVAIGKHPICALHITLPLASVDVNVHPSKLEVRFRDDVSFRVTAESLLLRAISQDDAMLDIDHLVKNENKLNEADNDTTDKPSAPSCEQEISAEEKLKNAKIYADKQGFELKADEEYFAQLRPSGSNEDKPHSSLREGTPVHRSDDRCDALPERLADIHTAPVAFVDHTRKNNDLISDTVQVSLKHDVNPPRSEAHSTAKAIPEIIPASYEDISQCHTEYTIIGSLLKTYLLLEADGSLVIIDQHAAHERIMFERFKKQIDIGVASQSLLIPIILTMTPREIAILDENRDVLAEAGYDISLFGEREIRVSSVPMILGKADYKALFAEMIDDLVKLKDAQTEIRMREVISFSCRKAVKAGDTLSNDEIEALISDMLASGAPPTCPHGRPVAKVITRSELEKMFWRA